MAITKFSPGRYRRRVAYVGEAPSVGAMQEFAGRELEFVEYNEVDLVNPVQLITLDSLVISQQPQDPVGIRKLLKRHAARLLDYDCRVYVRVAHSEPPGVDARAVIVSALLEENLPVTGLLEMELKDAQKEVSEREGIAFAPVVSICDVSVGWNYIANCIADNPSGESPNLQLNIDVRGKEGEAIEFEEDTKEAWKILLQRAFPDCADLHLIQMVDGMSKVPVFRAYAGLKGPLGPRPFLCFVKIGKRSMIAAEYHQYRQHALTYVPYHLGPRLNSVRCGLGANDGIIVGDFVEEAEVLRDCANSGRGVPVIANLFNTTLRAWQDLSTVDTNRSLFSFYGEKFPEKIPKEREKYIREAGTHLSLPRLKALFKKLDSSPVRVGPIHGDLHATNVLARGTDAIVIDFEKSHHDSPLLFDAASLEGGLFVEGFVNDKRSAIEIMNSVLPLYENGVRLHLPEACHPKDASTWYFDCVRQIRLYARLMQCQSGQYSAVLAYCLIRKACNDSQMDERRQRLRACAYHLGQTILKARAPSRSKRMQR